MAISPSFNCGTGFYCDRINLLSNGSLKEILKINCSTNKSWSDFLYQSICLCEEKDRKWLKMVVSKENESDFLEIGKSNKNDLSQMERKWIFVEDFYCFMIGDNLSQISSKSSWKRCNLCKISIIFKSNAVILNTYLLLKATIFMALDNIQISGVWPNLDQRSPRLPRKMSKNHCLSKSHRY